MSTKSTKSAGSQFTPKGVTQGVTLVDQKSGDPIGTVEDSNGVKRLAVDGNFTAQNVQAQVELDFNEDSVEIGDSSTGNTMNINDDGSIDANIEVDAADGDNIGLKLQQRNNSPSDSQYNKRVTAVTGSNNTDTTSIDVSIHDHNGNSINEDNPLPVFPQGKTSVLNSTTTTLLANESYTGTFEDISDYSGLSISIFADQNSATDGLEMQWSSDGLNIDRIEETNVFANQGRAFNISRRARYFRIKYINGTTNQSIFRLGVVYGHSDPGFITRPLNRPVTDDNFAQLTRAVITGEGPNGGSYINRKSTGISNLNSTSTPLTSNSTYTGTFEDVSGYGTISITVFSSHASATNGLIFEISSNGINVDSTDTYTISANNGKVYSIPAFAKFFRVRYINGNTTQTTFRLQTKYHVEAPKASSHKINDNIVDQDDAELVKAVITGQRPDGTFTNIDTTTSGNLKVSIQEFDPSTFGPKTVTQSPTVNIATDQSTINVNTEGFVAVDTNTVLGIGGIFTSPSIDTKDFGTIVVSAFSNVVGSFTIQWSRDQINWRDDGDIYSITANTLKTSTYGPKLRYVRAVYTNGGTTQTTFEFQLILKRNHTKPSSHKASEAFNDSTDLEGTKAVVSGKAPNGTYVNWSMTNGGSGKISLAEFESNISQNNQLLVADIITTNTGVQGSLTVGISAVEVKVGGSALANRKEVTLYNNSATILYWGRNSSVTTANGTPIYPQELMVWKKGPNSPIFVIGSIASQNTRITEDA